MTTPTAAAPIRLRSPSDIVEAVPYLIGFQPADSLVLLSLRGDRRRLGLTARVDLPTPEAADRCARDLIGFLRRDGASRAILAVYPVSGGPSHPGVVPIVAAMTDHLALAGIEVCEVVCISEGRWWSMMCDDETCCPPDGTPVSLESTSACVVAMTVGGRAVLGSREELERTIEPVNGVVRAAMAYALPLAEAELADRILSGRRAEVAAESLELFRAAVRDHDVGEAVGRSDIDAMARLVVGIADVHVRDEILNWSQDDRADSLRALLLDLARHALAPYEVAPLTTLAWTAYLQGDGAVAGIALDRALRGDPDYRFAVLLDQALVGGLNPSVFRAGLKTSSTAPAKRSNGPTNRRYRRSRER